MNKKKAMAFLLVSVMAGSMLAGCGSDNASSSNWHAVRSNLKKNYKMHAYC